MQRIAREARQAARVCAKASAAQREAALHGVARGLRERGARILGANRADLDTAARGGMAAPMIERLRLDEKRLGGMAQAVEDIAAMADPLGQIVRSWRRPNGLLVEKRRIPLGVILMVYESRPNVTTDAFALCLRAGNAVLLRGGSEAFHTNQALGEIIADGLEAAGLPVGAGRTLPTTDRLALAELLKLDEYIDLVIPRGGEGLIRFVSETARIPVIKHYRGVCHVYVDAAADLDAALAICENAKVQRSTVCNAAETILVHEAIAPAFLPRLVERLAASGVEIRGDETTRRLGGERVVPATPGDFGTEFLGLIVAVKVVPALADAVRHIEAYGSDHTEAIVTRDDAAAQQFLREVDSSTVLVNASTRFADGGELGLGAEIGISTTRLHAYGPMGAEELTTTKFVVHGDGQIRS
jgi:glutamate-5-semialdehyde dehydrogenase